MEFSLHRKTQSFVSNPWKARGEKRAKLFHTDVSLLLIKYVTINFYSPASLIQDKDIFPNQVSERDSFPGNTDRDGFPAPDKVSYLVRKGPDKDIFPGNLAPDKDSFPGSRASDVTNFSVKKGPNESAFPESQGPEMDRHRAQDREGFQVSFALDKDSYPVNKAADKDSFPVNPVPKKDSLPVNLGPKRDIFPVSLGPKKAIVAAGGSRSQIKMREADKPQRPQSRLAFR
jgi:hypothetical protein